MHIACLVPAVLDAPTVVEAVEMDRGSLLRAIRRRLVEVIDRGVTPGELVSLIDALLDNCRDGSVSQKSRVPRGVEWPIGAYFH